MATIVIKDLNESKKMDREAMRAVTGGSSKQNLRIISPDRSLFSDMKRTSNEFEWASFKVDAGTSG